MPSRSASCLPMCCSLTLKQSYGCPVPVKMCYEVKVKLDQLMYMYSLSHYIYISFWLCFDLFWLSVLLGFQWICLPYSSRSFHLRCDPIYFNPIMDKYLHPYQSVGDITYQFPYFNGATLYWACDCLSILGLKSTMLVKGAQQNTKYEDISWALLYSQFDLLTTIITYIPHHG